MHPRSPGGPLSALLAAALLAGCRTPPAPAPVDLSEPGWRVQRGQAVWRPAAGRPELAGELLVASHPDGRQLVEFSKPPVPLVLGHISESGWDLRLGPGPGVQWGRGEPPAALVWLQLPRLLAGAIPAPGWQLERAGPGAWSLAHAASGESLRGYLLP